MCSARSVRLRTTSPRESTNQHRRRASSPLTPSAVDGEIVLSPQSLQLAGAEISAAALRDQFGSVADAVVRDWPVCIAQYLPAGLTLTGMSVDGDMVAGEFAVARDVLTNPAQLENGTCE